MLDGIFHNPTIIHFGRGMERHVGTEVARHSKKILLHYGSDSFFQYGLCERVTASLKEAGVVYVELGGVKPNPRDGLVRQGIELCRAEEIDFVLAVGGGSVIDSAKAISVGVPWQGSVLDIFDGKHVPCSALKVGTILTIPGSGSESSSGAVITFERERRKIPYGHPLLFPVFSILNPEVSFTLSPYQTSCGIMDAISHVLERYFTNTPYVDCTDRICEGLIRTLMKYGPIVANEPRNYDVRAEIMWASKLAHDNTAGFGRKQDWACHSIAHELGALSDVSHGALLGVIFPAWMRHLYKKNLDRFTQFAERVFDIRPDVSGKEAAIREAVDAFERFVAALGLPTNLRSLNLSDGLSYGNLAEKCVKVMPSGTLGNFVRLSPADIRAILEAAH